MAASIISSMLEVIDPVRVDVGTGSGVVIERIFPGKGYCRVSRAGGKCAHNTEANGVGGHVLMHGLKGVCGTQVAADITGGGGNVIGLAM